MYKLTHSQCIVYEECAKLLVRADEKVTSDCFRQSNNQGSVDKASLCYS